MLSDMEGLLSLRLLTGFGAVLWLSEEAAESKACFSRNRELGLGEYEEALGSLGLGGELLAVTQTLANEDGEIT